MAAHEIHRSLDAVLGNVALLLTQMDPGSDAHARAWRALQEAKRIRDIVSGMAGVSPVVTNDPLRDAGSLLVARGRRGRHPARNLARNA